MRLRGSPRAPRARAVDAPVCSRNASAVAPLADSISRRFVSNVAADPPVIWNTAPSASVEPNSFPTAVSLPSVVPISASMAPFSPCVWMSVCASAAPSRAIASRIPRVGFSSPASTALSCVLTSAVEPVTPLNVA